MAWPTLGQAIDHQYEAHPSEAEILEREEIA